MGSRREIREYIVESFLFGDDEGLGDSDSLLEAGVVDSTGVMELVAFLEGTLGVEISEEDLVPENLDSIDSIVAFLGRKRSVPAAPPRIAREASG